MVGYGGHSETERVLVNNEGLAILSLLKIQSDLLGNLWDLSFDGDEMNLHMPQDPESEAELRNLAAVPYQIISPANNSSIIGIYQDSMLGCYQFTRPNIRFNPRDAMNILMMFNGINERELLENIKEKGGITSFDILSQIMPPLSIKYKTKAFKEDKDDPKTSNAVLEIRNGKFIRGQIDKSVMGAGTKGLLQRVCNDFGNMSSAKFVDDLQNVVTEYMKSAGFSVGISDLISDQKTNDEIVQVITKKKTDVKNLIDQVQIGIFENNTGKTNEEEFETQVNSILNQATSEAGKIGLKSLDKDNRFVIMVNAGSKGSDLNISQMISCLGQQNVDGKRIPYGFENRTLPHFTKYDDSPSARGFVESSYINGLSPQELFFHAMGGRVGLIDTAVKSVTWETPIVIIESGNAKYIEIGKWIDGQLDNAKPELVQHFTERQMELMNLENGDVFIPTTDENGIVTWGEVTAITRHDPGTELYEIKTSGGRNVIVTESKSLLIWNDKTKKLVETPTPEIRVGDCVPVTMELCEPPVILESVNVSNYLSKREYIYGTDFNKAIQLMLTTMEGENKIPVGWWNENNGKTFTLPYNKKASLQRVAIRTNLENIKDGCIYPYHAFRKNTLFQDNFKLNEENGIFIGLFLAEGNAHSNCVYITNLNENIKTFVKTWFDNHSIKWKETSRINKIGGTTESIIGNCGVLADFLTKFVGKGAANKYIPTEAFIAPEEFITGLLNGYFSGDGTISKNSIEVSSASKRLIEGISMLCSRLGIFGKVFKTQLKSNNLGTKNIKPSYRFSIRAQWGENFSRKVHLMEEIKQEKLSAICWNTSHVNFDTYNDVVLDKITEINIIGVENYPKVYDLTIPSTLNFGLANGLQVRDTSTTGYIQRRLIKGLEDLMVSYDMTIRTNKNKIVQFAYGDDNIDTTKVENQMIPIVSMSTQEIYAHFLVPEESGKIKTLGNIFLKNVHARYKKQLVDFMDKTQRYIDMMIEKRESIIKYVFKNKSDSVVNCPVAFQYIINNIQGQCNISVASLVDITLLEALEMIEQCFNNLSKIYYAPPTELFKTLYYYYLSPKDLLIVKRFNKAALTLLLDTITIDYKRAIVAPGEMVGMIAGQSIGEVSTQMTLNSVTFETHIIVRNREGNIQKVQIGEFIEKHIKMPKNLEYYKDKDTTYAEMSEYYEIPSCTEDGEIVWKEIEAVTRHPVINKDGTNTMLKVTTNENREVIATKAKSFLKLINGKIIEAEGSELKVGDYLPISLKQIDFKESTTLDLKEVLSPTEYMYSSEIEKAKSVMHEHQWWSKHSDKTFVVPYKRSDSFVAKISDKLRNGCNSKTSFTPGCVYTKQTNMCNYQIPENIELDYNFGYLLGAYASEGCMTKFQVSISNNDSEYFKPILELCEKWNITTKIYKHENKCQEGWTSQDLRIYNTILCRILEKFCGKLSHNKFVSDKIIFSNKECLLGFLDAYIGGDGTINKKDKSIIMASVSKDLLMDVQQMLNILGIYSFITKPSKVESNNRGSKDIKQLYTLFVRNAQAKMLASQLNMKLQYKQENLQVILMHNPKYKINRNATFVPNEIDGTIVMQKREQDYQDVLFDKIVEIEEVENTTNYAYDLTIKDTKNFNTYNGLCLRDTFHFAGVASKSNVTRGVPRIEEILSLSSDIKNPSLSIYLNPEDERSKEKAQTIMYMLEHTKLEEIVKGVQVCFDPDDLNSLIAEDKDTIEQYRAFENMVDECNEESLQNSENEKSKWVIRMEMDPEVMLEKNITMDDVNFTLKSCFEDQVSCVYSDFNADKLIFRIRMSDVIKNGSGRGQNKSKVNPLDQSDQIYILKNFQDQLLQNVVLRGIKGINKVILRKVVDNMVENNGIYKKEDIWVLDTIGTNLMDVLGLNFIDTKRTMSNDIVEIYNVLGIEAARQAIYNELVEVVEFDGTYINFHNYSVLVDRMTYTEKMISIFRHGINNDNIGPIAKASFEETPEMFLKAARHAELDTLRGVSANVMCGQEGFFGTSAFQVVLNIEEMQKFEAASEYKPQNAEDEIEKFFGQVDNPDDKCSVNKIAIQNNVITIQAQDMGEDNEYNPGF
jgi:DNA-directed RNA polymerase beta' subunit